MFLTISLAIIDTDHHPSTHPSKGRLSLGRQHDACYVVWATLLSAMALRILYFTHFNLFYFPNVIGLVQQIVRFVMCTEPKASYRTVQYEYAYRYTPSEMPCRLMTFKTYYSQYHFCFVSKQKNSFAVVNGISFVFQKNCSMI